jgi:hypothetical protein
MAEHVTADALRVDPHVAAQIKGMLSRGDKLVDIAVWFGLNLRVVHAVQSGALYPFMPLAPEHALPPAGPYSRALAAYAALAAVQDAERRLARQALSATYTLTGSAH